MRAVGYIRVSKVGVRGGDSFLSPELQREQIEHVAHREGLDVVEVIEELDASGGDAARPGWNRAIEMVERGEVGGIAVWNISRIGRSTRVQRPGPAAASAQEDTVAVTEGGVWWKNVSHPAKFGARWHWKTPRSIPTVRETGVLAKDPGSGGPSFASSS